MKFEKNNLTPEGAVLLLESAYNSKNLEMVFELIDFNSEAERIIEKVMSRFTKNVEIINETAEALRMSLKKKLNETGWPSFMNNEIHFSTKKIDKDLFVVSEFLKNSFDRPINKLYIKLQHDGTYKVAGTVTEE